MRKPMESRLRIEAIADRLVKNCNLRATVTASERRIASSEPMILQQFFLNLQGLN
jgi:hypothetical protein